MIGKIISFRTYSTPKNSWVEFNIRVGETILEVTGNDCEVYTKVNPAGTAGPPATWVKFVFDSFYVMNEKVEPQVLFIKVAELIQSHELEARIRKEPNTLTLFIGEKSSYAY